MISGRKIVCFAALVLTLLCVAAPPVQAARFTGAYLVRICGVGADGAEISPGAHAACQSYISGVIDYHNMLRGMKIAPEINICVPSAVTLNELHVVVLRYLERNAQHDSFIAAPAVLLALYDKYPCGGGRR